MLLKRLIFFSFLSIGVLCRAQNPKDSVLRDTSFLDYDEIFSELDALLDSLNTPRSFALANLSLSRNFLSYINDEKNSTETKRRYILSPSVGYFDKSGFGVSASTSLIHDSASLSPYQYSVTGSYDYLKVRTFITGLSYTHFFIKDDLPFYTSPLQSELYAYFTLRKLWFKPSVAASYGWGSRQAFEEREETIENILLAKNGYTRINTEEKIIDFNLIASVRHDFYFLNTFSKNDFVRITPQISFTSGTQQFGFNQTANTYGRRIFSTRNELLNTDKVSLDNSLYFQPVSLTTFLKTEYSRGKFYLQPQVFVDYYFPAEENNYTTSFLINLGVFF